MGKIIQFNIEEKNKRFSFDEEFGNMIGLPENIFDIFYNIIFKDYWEIPIYEGFYARYNSFVLIEKQIDVFSNISITIGNKIINLNKQIFKTENTLYINKILFEHDFYFGLKFLELFNIIEFDLYTNDINLYMEKNKDYIIEKKDNKKDYKNSNLNIFTIVFFLLLISIIITALKNSYKNKKIEYYHQYEI